MGHYFLGVTSDNLMAARRAGHAQYVVVAMVGSEIIAQRRRPLTPARGRGFDCGLRAARAWRLELKAGQVLRAKPCSTVLVSQLSDLCLERSMRSGWKLDESCKSDHPRAEQPRSRRQYGLRFELARQRMAAPMNNETSRGSSRYHR